MRENLNGFDMDRPSWYKELICLIHRSYLSTIPTYNSHFLLSRSGNSFLKNSHFPKKEFPLLFNKKWEFKWELKWEF